ncbi:MAG: threonine synthase [Candidatus Nanopelagicales bacterium]
MRYISTRGGVPAAGFTDILLTGLAADGGLYLPAEYPQVTADELDSWRALSYAGLATEILSRFIDDIPAEDLAPLVARTYTAEVFRYTRPEAAAAITPLRSLEPGLALLELSNGPTLAFKDMAMQLLGNLFEYELSRRGQNLNILGATSGDTGSSAEYALRGKAGVNVFMLSPHGRMTDFQRAQMYSLPDANIYNVAITGVFDDAQDVVKEVFADPAFKAQYQLGAVNSINWGRLVAQVVYYFAGYLAATTDSRQQVSFAVPSGNFGNICAGHVARSLGLPINRLVLATNENDVLAEFFATGVYRPRSAAETAATSSPSMDISKASNFERFVFDLVGRDPAVVNSLWRQLADSGSFDLSGTPAWERIGEYGIVAGSSTHADRLATIKTVHESYGTVIDPHTADGVKLALAHREPGEPMLAHEVAQPAKFAATIRAAIGQDPARPAELVGLEELPQRVSVLPPDAAAIKEFIAAHA